MADGANPHAFWERELGPEVASLDLFSWSGFLASAATSHCHIIVFPESREGQEAFLPAGK